MRGLCIIAWSILLARSIPASKLSLSTPKRKAANCDYRYFLITPKLLSDLMYHPRMRIHCIYSGEWVGENFTMDFKKYLKAGRKLKAKRGVNGAASGRARGESEEY
jgi:hypothetical protein